MSVASHTCLCGSVVSEITTAKPQLAVFCHCNSCQVFGGGPAPVAAFKPDEFRVVKGQDSLNSYESSKGKYRVSCRKCGSFVHNTLPNGLQVVRETRHC